MAPLANEKVLPLRAVLNVRHGWDKLVRWPRGIKAFPAAADAAAATIRSTVVAGCIDCAGKDNRTLLNVRGEVVCGTCGGKGKSFFWEKGFSLKCEGVEERAYGYG